jgi:tetratricopeptide (TPR) repeat protein/2-polyprenyl-3-methyl-5-hydroxy-6-metoxy-1,4-benzoquinol methylase
MNIIERFFFARRARDGTSGSKSGKSGPDALRLIDQGHLFEADGLIEQAMKCYLDAIPLAPNPARAYLNYGNILQVKGDLKGALNAFRNALKYNPDYAGAYYNLGNALLGNGQIDEAVDNYRRALEINPDYAEVHCCLGIAQKELGQFDSAVTNYKRALEINPDLSEAYINLDSVLMELERFPEAEANLRRALESRPACTETLNKLASFLIGRGEPIEVLGLIMRSLKIEEKLETRMIFVKCAKRMRLKYPDNDFRDILIRALTEPWCRPKILVKSCANHIKLNPDIGGCIERAAESWPQRLTAQDLFAPGSINAAATDSLLRTLLCSTPINDIGLERFLTMVRRIMLNDASAAMVSEAVEENTLAFYCALARQCFINEYVFAWTDEEASQAQALLHSLVVALETEAPIPVPLLVTVAAYFPLYSIPFAARLLDRSWPDTVTAILTQQVRGPAEEQRYRNTMPRLTAIEDEVSLLVKNQYEENPYPRWIKTEPASEPVSIDNYLRHQFPLAPYQPLGKHGNIDILIAGCGTGQHPIGRAQQLQGARILAIDLSLSSLCYAKKKTQELGLTMIEYAQADILKLGSLDCNFDIIEASGVLHHLADPWAGWRALISLLRPGGLMKLGFYSEVARRDIVQLRSVIAKHGYGSTANEIRQCRQILVELGKTSNFETTLESSDFFSISACRDLLFHVQEHRMTLPSIDAFLRENNLSFLGFEIEEDVLRAYKLRFPDDRAAINLGQWHIFENENHNTFVEMYQFWIQKAG